MPINRTDIVKAELLKQSCWDDHALGMFFKAFGEFKQWRCHLQHLFAYIFGSCIELSTHQLRKVAVERPNGWAD